MDFPSLWTLAGLILLAAILEAAALGFAGALRVVLHAAAGAVGFLSLLGALERLWAATAEGLEDVRRALAVTKESELAHALRNLSAEQTAIVRGATEVAVDVLPRENGAIYYLRGTSVTLDFVDEFLANSDAVHLCPVRRWTEGSRGREQAQELTAWLIQRGLATPANGNHAARWAAGVTPTVLRDMFWEAE